MRRFLIATGLAFGVLILTLVALHMTAARASAASITAADAARAVTAGDLLTPVQGYGGGGGSYDNDDDDGDDDDNGYRHRRRYSDYYGYRRHNGYNGHGYDYCRSCAYRCSDGGWCPPRCWGWWRNCRWHRRDY